MLGVAGCSEDGGAPEDYALVREIVHDLLLGEPAWEVVSAHEEFPPSVGELWPSRDRDVDGIDLSALILPPPARVRFEVDDVDGPLRLRTAVGAHQRVPRQVMALGRPVDVVFEVAVDGELAFEHRLRFDPEAPGGELTWTAVGGERGLALEAGQVVELATRCETPDGAGFVPDRGLQVGFGRLRLERLLPVRRTVATPEQPNVVLVVQDTLRRDRLSLYGYDRPTSPVLDGLAGDGLVYDAAHASSSWTWPSTASILTGLLPERHGVLSEASCYLDTALEVLPEALQRLGFTTAGFSGNGLVASGKNFDQGFERFDCWPGSFVKSGTLMPRALEWLRANAERRFFLYLHLVDTHGLHDLLPEAVERFAGEAPDGWTDTSFREYGTLLKRARAQAPDGRPVDPAQVVPPAHQRYIQDMYDAAVRSGDWWIGQLVALLDELGVGDRTVVAFTSDHGEELFDHGLLKHGHSLHGELVGVPLILWGPGIPSGLRVDTPVSNRHLAYTLARIGGGELAGPDDPLDLARPAELTEAPVFFSTDHGLWGPPGRTTLRGVRRGPWILHAAPLLGDRPAHPTWRLFRGDRDPAEQRDLAADEPERARELYELVEAKAEREEGLRRVPGQAAGSGTIEFLEDIGYIGDD